MRLIIPIVPLEKSLALLGIQSLGGEDQVLDVIQAAKVKGELSKAQHQRQRQKVRELAYCANRPELAVIRLGNLTKRCGGQQGFTVEDSLANVGSIFSGPAMPLSSGPPINNLARHLCCLAPAAYDRKKPETG